MILLIMFSHIVSSSSFFLLIPETGMACMWCSFPVADVGVGKPKGEQAEGLPAPVSLNSPPNLLLALT